jgi:Tol biopolymer transport system component
MKRYSHFLLAFLVLGLSVLACSSSFQVVGTPSPASEQNSTPIVVPEVLLPHNLYYSGADNVGVTQLFRLERDGKTVTQITHEPAAVGRYDVSRTDGSVVYVVNNQLILINGDGSDRRTLVDGGPLDSNNPLATSLYRPVFSPDSQTIAYAHHGLNMYNVATGVSNVVLPDELYRPEKYSPDGAKLLMTVSVPNSDATHDVIYDLATNTVANFNSVDGAFFCCGREQWTHDGLSLYAAYPAMGILSPGLWRVDAASGNVTTLLPAEAGDGKFNLADEPYLAADGQLYYFFANASDTVAFSDQAPLQIVRSAPDGVTGRTVLRPETFASLTEALWAPDGSFVIVAKAPLDSNTAGSIVELYYTDTAKNMVSLLPSGQPLQWGP